MQAILHVNVTHRFLTLIDKTLEIKLYAIRLAPKVSLSTDTPQTGEAEGENMWHQIFSIHIAHGVDKIFWCSFIFIFWCKSI